MIEIIVLSAIQGITEWLPVSSEGMIVLVNTNFFGGGLAESVGLALFLHLGTFFAALLYFRAEVWVLLKQFVTYFKQPRTVRRTLNFYIVATIVSGIIGVAILMSLQKLESVMTVGSVFINLALAITLFVTMYLQVSRKRRNIGVRDETDLSGKEGIWLGIVQGFATLPGMSRSGSTMAGLLFRRFNEEVSLRVSFIMSLPIVLAGNILLNITKVGEFSWQPEYAIGLVISFVLGYFTIGALLALARRVNFGWFAGAVALLLVVSALITIVIK